MKLYKNPHLTMGKEKNVSFHCLSKKENILTKLNDLVFKKKNSNESF